MRDLCIIHDRPLEEGELIDFVPGEKIFTEGDPVKGVFCLHDGRVALMKRHESDEDLLIFVAEPGDILGIPGVVIGDHYLNSAVALSDVSVCFTPRDRFMKLIRIRPEIIMQAMQRLSRRIDRIEQAIDESC
jgi:CRP-like cAMP-binding protein